MSFPSRYDSDWRVLSGFALILDFGLMVHSHAVFIELQWIRSVLDWRKRERDRGKKMEYQTEKKKRKERTALVDPAVAAAHISPNRSAFNLTAREEMVSQFSPAAVMHHKFCLHSLLGSSRSHLVPNILTTLSLLVLVMVLRFLYRTEESSYLSHRFILRASRSWSRGCIFEIVTSRLWEIVLKGNLWGHIYIRVRFCSSI